MPFTDAPLDVLRAYRTSAPAPADLDAYWERALAEARAAALPPQRVPYREGIYGALAVDDLTFSGAGGHPIRAWLLRPRGSSGRRACRVSFIGYGGGRGLPVDHAVYAAAGHVELVMDTRAQGGSWVVGHTGDPGAAAGAGPEGTGVLTRGILDAESYYYRRLYVDAVRAVETAAALDIVDPGRIAVAGFSQGGALALASAALAPELVRLCHADMPFLCDVEHALGVALEQPYLELVDWLRLHGDVAGHALATLRYVDCALLAPRIGAPTLVSVGLMDPICPPSGVFAAYNAIVAEKELAVFPYSPHEVPSLHAERQLADFVARLG